MAAERDDDASLRDTLTAACAVDSFVKGRCFEDYTNDLMLRSAVERQVEIIGEAARRVSMQFQKAHLDIPWRPIQAQRHVLAHEYGALGVDAHSTCRNNHRLAVLAVGQPA